MVELDCKEAIDLYIIDVVTLDGFDLPVEAI